MEILKNVAKRMLSLTLAVVMLLSMCPVVPLEASAAAINLGIDGLSASDTNGKWQLNNGTLTGTVSSTKYTAATDCDPAVDAEGASDTLTFTYTGQYDAVLKFTLSITKKDNGSVSLNNAVVTTSGLQEIPISKGDTVTVGIETNPTNIDDTTVRTTTVTITGISVEVIVDMVDTIFAPASGGTYTVDGDTISENTTKQKTSTDSYAVVATADSGYTFLGWWSETDQKFLADEASATLIVGKNTTITPMFKATEGLAMFGVGDQTFHNLTLASQYAKTNGQTQINLKNTGTLYGTHTIDPGITLLIPFDDANTLDTTKPGSVGAITRSTGNELTAASKLYRKLTMANGAKIVVNGAISVGSKHTSGDTSGQWWCGSPYGPYGQIDMQSGSSITVNNGGVLYAWGYVTGSGKVDVLSGGKVYEMFQIQGFRGGSKTTGMIGDKERVLPFSQYYVQNVEVEMTIYPGGNEYVYSNIYMGGTDNPSTVHFIGGSGSMFAIGSGAWVTKKYEPSTDRLIVSVNGSSPDSTVSVESMSVSFTFYYMPYTVNSSDYVLPINNNITINVNSGTAQLTEDVALLAGSQVNVADGATLHIANGKSVYLYDETEWKSGLYVHHNMYVKPIGFSPTKTKTRGNNDLPDAVIDANGYVLVEGYLYTTASGANITSSKGTGVVEFWNSGGSETVTYQAQQPDNLTYSSIAINNAWLKNADGSFTKTADEIPEMDGGTYFYNNGKWSWYTYSVTYDANDGTGNTVVEKISNYDHLIGPANEKGPAEYELKDVITKPGYTVGWNTQADGQGTAYAAGDMIEISKDWTLYAQWERKAINVILNNADGSELARKQGQVGSALDWSDVTLPTREGYTLVWTDDNGNEHAELPATILESDTDVIYTVTWKGNSYEVTLPAATNMTVSGDATATCGTDYTATLEPDQCYTLTADNISVTIGDKAYTGFEYASNTLTIPGDDVTGDVQITATALAAHEYTYECDKNCKNCNQETRPGAAHVTNAEHPCQNGNCIYCEEPVTGAQEHDWADADCDTPKTCSICGETEGEALDHTPGTAVEEERVEATCGKNGSYKSVVYCTECGEKLSTTPNTIQATGNHFDGDDENHDCDNCEATNVDGGHHGGTATCVEAAVCDECGQAYGSVDSAKHTGGTEVRDDSAATVDAPGYTGDTYCLGCNTKIGDGEPIPQLQIKVETSVFAVDDITEEIIQNTNYTTVEQVEKAMADVITELNDKVEETVLHDATLMYRENDEAEWKVATEEHFPEKLLVALPVPEDTTPDTHDFYVVHMFTKGEKAGQTENPEIVREYEVDGAYYIDFYVTGLSPIMIGAVEETHTVTFQAGEGGIGEMEQQTIGTVTASSLTSNAFTKTGYHFVGWDADDDGNADYTDGEPITISDDITLTALWEINTYAVTYKADGVQVGEVQMIAHGSDAVAPEIPTKTGYDQTAPYWDKDGKNITGPITINAVYTPNTYTIRYVMEENDETALYEAIAKHGDKLPEYKGEALSNLGFTFDGWACGGNFVNSETVVIGDMTVYSQWTLSQYTIKFSDGVADLTFTVDGTYALPTPTKDGYDFKGWKDGKDNVYTSETTCEAMITAIEENGEKGEHAYEYSISLTAVWEEKLHTVTFDANGGEGTMDPQTIGEVTEVALTEYAFSRAGYEFLGWSTDKHATAVVYQDMDAITVTGDTTLYAIWKAGSSNYTVKTYTMDLDGKYVETNSEPLSAETDSEISVTPETIEGFTLDEENSVLKGIATADGKTELSVYYIRNQYSLTFTINGAEHAKNEKVYFGAAISTPAYDVPVGHTFTGWTVDETMPAKDMTYDATLTADIYTITYDLDGGALAEGVTNPADYTVESDAITLANPTREGYTFQGWTGTGLTEATLEVTIPAGSTGNREYTAKWQINQYTVTWVGTDEEETLDYGTALEFKGTLPTKTGYVVDGWKFYTMPGYVDYYGTTVPASNVYAYPNWIKNTAKFTITFYDGETVVDSFEVQYDDFFTAPAVPEKKGYTFVDWVDANGDSMPGKLIVEADQNYYVKREAITYNAIFDANGGAWGKDTTKTVPTAFDAEIMAPADPTKTGYEFKGWTPEVGTMDDVNGKTFTALWEINTYTVTFTINGEAYGEPVEVEFGATITAPEYQIPEGHTFSGWTVDETMPAEDMTYDATLTINQYRISFADGDPNLKSYTADYGTEYTIPTPTKEGHTFLGWYDSPNPSTNNRLYKGGETIILKKNEDLFGRWEVNAYAITWKIGGEEVASTTATYGEAIDNPTVTIPGNYYSYKWTTEIPETMPADENLVIEGYWMAELTMLARDGSVMTSAYDLVVPVGDSVYASYQGDSNYVEGHTLYLVNIEDETEKYEITYASGSPVYPSVPMTQNKTLQLTAVPEVYTITWKNIDGETLAWNSADWGTTPAFPEGTTPAYPVEMMEDGYTYTFIGWASEQGGEKLETLPTVTAETEFFAVYEKTANYYYVNWYVDGEWYAQTIVAFGQPITEPEMTLTKEGYSFNGWTVPETMPAKKITLDAGWTVNKYDITWDVDGNKTVTEDVEFGTVITLPENPTKEGYAFTGWEGYTDGMTMPDNAVTLTAQWEVETYTVTWIVDGETYTTTVATYGQPIAEPENDPTKEGHTFNGWADVPEKMPDDDALTIEATWTANKYNITWMANGGCFFGIDGFEQASSILTYGNTLYKYNTDPTRTAYTFVGWNTAPDGSGESWNENLTVPAFNVTYYAQWKVNTYTVTFDSNGGKGEMAPQTVEHGITERLNSNAFALVGHSFAGWSGSDGKTYADGANVTLTDDLTLTAQWKRETYTVTWNVDGDQSNQKQYAYGDKIIAPENPSKTGYDFIGWDGYTEGMTMPDQSLEFTAIWEAIVYDIKIDADGDGILEKTIQVPYSGTLNLEDGVKPDDKTNTYNFLGWSTSHDGEVLENIPPVTEDASYYAVFETVPITYTITLEELGGTELDNLTGGYEAMVTLPEATGKTGYNFIGWAETADPNAETMAAGTEITITDNDTLYAVWQIKQYTITFVTDGGTQIDPITQDYGTAVIAPADPEKEGHKFLNWDKAIPETMPAEDMTITAQFQINTYTIGWDTNEDGEADFEDTVNWNVVPEYDAEKYGAITKESTVDKVYTFSGWTVEPVAATSDVIYIAKFDSAVREYTITWNIEGEESTTSVAYDTVPTPPAASKAEDNYNTYTFASWNTLADGTGSGIEAVSGDATYYALFTPVAKVYTLTLDLNGGHIGEQNMVIYTGGYGEEITAPEAEPEKTGHTFAGWDDEIPAELTETKTIKATWTINQYTITLNTGVGEPIVITQDYGTQIQKPADPEKEGYSFTGWTPAIPGTMPAENKEYVAGWSINQYTITFDTAGGSEIAPITADFGADVTAPADPSRPGYTFTGWDGEIPATMPASNMKLTASWEANTNTITITVGNGSEAVVITAKTDEDISQQLPADPTREGYIFGGWQDAQGNPVTLPEKMPAESAKYSAVWNVDQFIITFDLDGGMIGEQTAWTITADFEAPITTPADPEKEGYTFVKWVTRNAEGVETDYTVPEIMPAENVMVYAKWRINQYTISFLDDVGNVLVSDTLDYGAAVTVPEVSKEGHTFVQWNETIPGKMPAHNVEITSAWTVNQYTITFETDGGTAIDPITENFGTALTAPEAPTKTGYTFAGWDEEFPANMPATNLTLTAKWNLNEYTVTWLNDDGTELAKGTVKHGQLPVYEGAEPVKAETPELSFAFTGWTPEIVEATDDVSYTAVFEETRKSYTITYVYDNGEENTVETVVNGDAILAPEAPEKEGYTFNGWNPALPEIMPAQNITATAQWKKVEYTITFDADNGTETVAVTTGWGENYSKPADPVKEGYTFGGWANADGEVVTLPETMPVGGMALKAVWTVNRYTITFLSDGGSETGSMTFDYGAAVTAPEAPTKDGYTFLGWAPALPETMPATDLTVTAQWKWTYTGWFTDETGTTYLIDGQKAYFGQWKEIEGSTYYFDDQSYIVYDLYETTSPDGSHVGVFVFDNDGKLLKDKTGLHISNAGDTYWIENGEVMMDLGLVRVVLDDGEVNYYYFGEDGKAVKDTILWVEKNNGYLVKWDYTFDENGVIIHHEDTSRQGVHEDEQGVECYYIDGVKVHWGLFMIGEYYYYARTNGELVKNKTYWITVTNGLLEEGSYRFDEYGRIVFEELKNGIFSEDGSLFYYEDGIRTYRGLFEGDGTVGEKGYYYYVNTQGEVINNRKYWITKTNNLLPEDSYTFDEMGRIIFEEEGEKLNGFVEESDGIYYYVDGVKTYAGLIKVDSYYYYVNSSCKLITGRTYWITKTNGLMDEKAYTFDAQGRIILEQEEEPELKNGIVEENGTLYYYVNGVKTYAGLIEIDGSYYYVNSSCKVVTGRSYWITKTNGLKAEGQYTFDSDGKMIL